MVRWSWSEFFETVIAGLLIGGLVMAIGFWYFAVYDTAKGKCQRGDVNACIVWEQQGH